MQSIINLLTFLNDNWTYIVIIVSLAFALYKKGVKLYNNVKKGKIDNTIVIVSNIILEKIAKSEKDFLNKLKMVEEELDETAHWLELVIDSEMIERNRLESLHEENLELLKIITRSIITMREKINKS